MGDTGDRGVVLVPLETLFGRICLERGWAARSQIADCLRGRSAVAAAGGDSSLPALLVARNVITAEQPELIRSEVSEVTRTGAYAEVREDDTWIGQLLVQSGAATPDKVEEALRVQRERARAGGAVPRVGEILLEKGHVTLAALKDALARQGQRTRLSCPGCGSKYVAEVLDPGKTYLCRKCTSPLSLSPSSRVLAVVPEPEEVRRLATNPKNVLGKYVAVRELGRGAMGAVYKAWDTEFRRWVALKVLLGAATPDLHIRFRREAETAAALQHPNIVPIYDVGETGGLPFIAMKYIEGETLVGLTLAAGRACDTMIQVARAVGYAHQRDIVHRDLKPANIMVDSSGRVYVMDFGLAKDLFGSSHLTAPGTVMGTPSYMAPEQAAGRTNQVNQRSDVYSLGAILYELLTGRPPFKGARPVETIHQVLNDPLTPPSRYRPEIPPDLERIILRALEKQKARRHETADVFADALERLVTGRSSNTEAPAGKATPRSAMLKGVTVAWILTVLLVAALAALWAYARR